MEAVQAFSDRIPLDWPLAVAAVCGVITLWLLSGLAQAKVPIIEIELTKAEAEDAALTGQKPSASMDIKTKPGMIQCYDPATMQHLGEVKAMTKEDVENLVTSARVAQKQWAKTTFAERRRVLQCLQLYILSHQEDICRVTARDSGKSKVDALLGEVMTTCEKIRTMQAYGEKWLKRDYRPPGIVMAHKEAYVEYHPLGVLGVIAPWNYPFHNVFNHIISGIFAGNAVISKASEYTSWSSRYISAITKEALRCCGHNPDLCQFVTGFGEAGAALVTSPGVDKIIFTGSPEVGKKIMAGAAPYLKPVILELGGKDPMVICEDANVSSVLPIAMRGVYQNCGQNCIGVERIFAYEGIYEEFCEKALAIVKQLRQGHALGEASVDCGAMVMPAQLDLVKSLVDDAVASGAKLLIGGKRNATLKGGLFFEPTILADVTPDMRIAQEEVFGPVMCILKVVPDDSDEKLLEMANASAYGLGSSVFSGNQARAIRIGYGLRCGMTTVNDFGVNYLVQSLPFGGVKHSGFDRFSGPEGLRACCLQKSVVVDRISFIKTSIPGIMQYPVGKDCASFAQAMIRVLYGPGIVDRVKGVFGLMTARR